MADDATRARIAAHATETTHQALEASLAALEVERTRGVEAHRRGWASEAETEKAMADIAGRRQQIETDLNDLDKQTDPEDIVAGLRRFEFDPAGPPEWLRRINKVVETGTIGPEDGRWPQVVAGLRDEIDGDAPDSPGWALSPWARQWAAHIVATLGLIVVVQPDGNIVATTDDPRDPQSQRRTESSTSLD